MDIISNSTIQDWSCDAQQRVYGGTAKPLWSIGNVLTKLAAMLMEFSDYQRKTKPSSWGMPMWRSRSRFEQSPRSETKKKKNAASDNQKTITKEVSEEGEVRYEASHQPDV
jgi:hypothetical protein